MATITWLLVTAFASTLIMTVSCQSNNSPDMFESDTSNGVSAIHQIKRPFFGGSRYGRSQQYGFKDSSPIVVPRNDRFFLGSRYGKRSQELYPEVFEQENTSTPFIFNEQREKLTCMYTGFSNFYRCVNEKPNINYPNDELNK